MSSVTMTWTQYRYQRCSIDGEEIKLTPQYTEFLLRLLLAPPKHFVPMDTLVEWLWPNPDLQPDWAYAIIHIICVQLAKKGINIEGMRGSLFKACRKDRYGGKRLVCRSQ